VKVPNLAHISNTFPASIASLDRDCQYGYLKLLVDQKLFKEQNIRYAMRILSGLVIVTQIGRGLHTRELSNGLNTRVSLLSWWLPNSNASAFIWYK
jgi:hypothetical protein